MSRKVIDLTGSKLHRALRNIQAETTRNDLDRQLRRAAFDRDFGNCSCGSGFKPEKCGCTT